MTSFKPFYERRDQHVTVACHHSSTLWNVYVVSLQERTSKRPFSPKRAFSQSVDFVSWPAHHKSFQLLFGTTKRQARAKRASCKSVITKDGATKVKWQQKEWQKQILRPNAGHNIPAKWVHQDVLIFLCKPITTYQIWVNICIKTRVKKKKANCGLYYFKHVVGYMMPVSVHGFRLFQPKCRSSNAGDNFVQHTTISVFYLLCDNYQPPLPRIQPTALHGVAPL